jgi:hypothetical protein
MVYVLMPYIPSDHAVLALFHNEIDIVAINASHSAREHSVTTQEENQNNHKSVYYLTRQHNVILYSEV